MKEQYAKFNKLNDSTITMESKDMCIEDFISIIGAIVRFLKERIKDEDEDIADIKSMILNFKIANAISDMMNYAELKELNEDTYNSINTLESLYKQGE